MLPRFIGAGATQALRRRRGRPVKEHRKVNRRPRLAVDVLDACKGRGPGWQPHIDQVLGEHTPGPAE